MAPETVIRQLVLLAGVASLFVALGCRTVPMNVTQYAGAPKFAPSDPAKVEILRKEPMVRAAPSSRDIDAMEQRVVVAVAVKYQ
jgi:hypothetical protein